MIGCCAIKIWMEMDNFDESWDVEWKFMAHNNLQKKNGLRVFVVQIYKFFSIGFEPTLLIENLSEFF